MNTQNSHAPSSRKVSSTFGLKAHMYDKQALFQTLLIEKLIDLSEPILIQHHKFADLGCGSALFAKTLHNKNLNIDIAGIDISLPSLQIACKRNTNSIQGDINSLPIKNDSVDGIVASSVLQWIQNIDYCLDNIYQCIKPDGYFLFSVFTSKSFTELNSTKKSLGLSVPVNLHSDSVFLSMLAALGFSVCATETIEHTYYFKSARDALKSLSSYGATAMPSQPLNRKALKELCDIYEKDFRTERGIPLTYSAINGYAKKNGSIQ